MRQVYDQLNGGQISAESIHDLLAIASANWLPPAPRFVLLFGDGTYDMRNYRGNSLPTFIPPYLELVDPDLGETATDNRYVTLSGNDNVPDMAIGRFVANTPEEAAVLVKKTIDYETGCNCGAWNYNLLFLSDDLEGGGGNFYSYSNKIVDGFADAPANTVPLCRPVIGRKRGTSAKPATWPATLRLPSNVANRLRACSMARARSLVSYVGHSTKTEWALELLMDVTLVNTLSNGPCLPINIAMTCLEGYFHEAGEGSQSLAEIAVRTPQHGAVAAGRPRAGP